MNVLSIVTGFPSRVESATNKFCLRRSNETITVWTIKPLDAV